MRRVRGRGGGGGCSLIGGDGESECVAKASVATALQSRFAGEHAGKGGRYDALLFFRNGVFCFGILTLPRPRGGRGG